MYTYVQVTDYMAKKTYNLAQYLGPFGAYLKPHNIIDYWIGPRTLVYEVSHGRGQLVRKCSQLEQKFCPYSKDTEKLYQKSIS